MSQEQTSIPTCCHKHQQLGYDDGSFCLGAPRGSLEAWKKEFYPISGKEAADQGLEAALLHGIQKWKGLLPENLKRFPELEWDYYSARLVMETDEFGFGITSCSLCQMFMLKASRHDPFPCYGCPLYDEEQETVCFAEDRAYSQIVDYGESPILMVEELEAALETWRKANSGIGQPVKAEE